MKINHFLIVICMMCIGFISPQTVAAQGNKADVKISETDHLYKFESRYDSAKSKKVQEFMTENLKSTGFKFTNAQLDAQLTLTGGINFYIKSSDGELKLKFDKTKNNADDYAKFKKMCEGIKAIVQEK